tara:strand:+ start:3398 stop:4828 length:1431 start_codon:yes stop_codon:yes gene_type:complete
MSRAITIRGLQKSYVPGVPVLRDFDFELATGEVHALVGSNGAGKSTLAKILSGLTPANSGEIDWHDGDASGVVMVLQELNVIPTLSVAENLFLKALPNKYGMIAEAELREKAVRALARVGLGNLDPDLPAGRLGVGQQQLMEIASALEQESSVLILDEPTAALTGPEIELLFDNVRALREQGVAILFISHRMDEIAQICDRVTVMRDGVRVATHQVDEVETAQLVREMAGNEIATRKRAKVMKGRGEVGISVTNLRAGHAVKGVTFAAHRGEILGIAGLIGAGRTETLRAIFGADPRTGGEVVVTGKRLALVPEDRKMDGLLLPLSVTANTILASANRILVDDEADLEDAERVCKQLDVKCDTMEQAVGDLSGGNQQKIVIARWLLCDCEVFLFDEPTRGIDVAAKEAIYTLLDELAEAGKTLVVVSSDLTELMSISHRIVVMSNGRITGEFKPDSWSREAITAAAFAGYQTREAA